MQRHGCCVRAARSDVRAARVAAALWRCAGVCKAKFFFGGGGRGDSVQRRAVT